MNLDHLCSVVASAKGPPSVRFAEDLPTVTVHIRKRLRRRSTLPPDPDRKFGKYRIIRQLGRGGMCVVYLAEDTQLRRRDRPPAQMPPSCGQ